MLSDLEDRQKSFFGSCRKLKPPERDVEFNNIRSEYQKVKKDSSLKIFLTIGFLRAWTLNDSCIANCKNFRGKTPSRNVTLINRHRDN